MNKAGVTTLVNKKTKEKIERATVDAHEIITKDKEWKIFDEGVPLEVLFAEPTPLAPESNVLNQMNPTDDPTKEVLAPAPPKDDLKAAEKVEEVKKVVNDKK